MTLIALISHFKTCFMINFWQLSLCHLRHWPGLLLVRPQSSHWSRYFDLIGQGFSMTHEEKWSNIAFALQGPVNNWLHHCVINPADQGRDKAECYWSVLEETSVLIGQDILTFRPTHQEDWLERGATITQPNNTSVSFVSVGGIDKMLPAKSC